MAAKNGQPFGNATELFKPYGARVKDVTMYVMGSSEKGSSGNYWTTLDHFPNYNATKFTLNSDGTLTTDDKKQRSSEARVYTYDPNDPVPSLGGSNLFLPCGPYDQSKNFNRTDILLYKTDPFEAPYALTGPMRANLQVMSDQIDTDFYVKIMDVYPTGEHKLIQEGGSRVRNMIHGYMKENEVYSLDISMWNTSYVFSQGHSIGISVTSSNHPRFSVNPNNGRAITDPKLFDDVFVASNSILPSSYVELPVVALADLPKTDVVDEINEKFDEKYAKAMISATHGKPDFFS